MAKQKDTPLSLEGGLDELEKIVGELEGGEMPLEKALEQFEKGVAISQTCRKQLEEAEHKVEILLKKGRGLEAEPFELEDKGGE